MERRGFLRLTGAAAAAALSGCGSSGSMAALSEADWTALAGQLTGDLLRPQSAGYDGARVVYNTRYDAVRPQAVARCRSADDVRAVLEFVRRFRLPVTPRSGGHGYAGYSTGSGVVIDVGPLNTVTTDGSTAVVGAGARLIDVYDALIARGVCIPSGSCASIGIAGITMGGGIGLLDRAHGLTCDALIAAQVVTADGRVLSCDAEREPELFWALRGGGGGNFGVTTSFTFRTHATRPVQFFSLDWSFAESLAVFAGWQSWARSLPDEIWSGLTFWAGEAPPAEISLNVHGLSLGDAGALERSLDALVARVGLPPSSRQQRSLTYRGLILDQAGCDGLTVSQCHVRGQTSDARLDRSAFAASSDIFDNWLPEAGVQALLDALSARHAPGKIGGVIFDLMGGAVNRVAPDATAFVHRNAAFTAQYLASYAPGTAAAVLDDAAQWVHGMRAVMSAWSNGRAYQNYVDPLITNWQEAYYGPNYPRLVRAKAQYDPESVFQLPQGIPPR
jgi:FAD/FMN-containing dehydrogenase